MQSGQLLAFPFFPLKLLKLRRSFGLLQIQNWVKGNCDGAYIHDFNKDVYGGIFIYHKGDLVVGFYEPLPWSSSFLVEFYNVLKAIEIASSYNLQNLWFESNSLLMVKDFGDAALVPWQFKLKWEKCRKYTLYCHICKNP